MRMSVAAEWERQVVGENCVLYRPNARIPTVEYSFCETTDVVDLWPGSMSLEQ